MKPSKYILIPLAALALAGCGDDTAKSAQKQETAANRTFIFFSHRKEIVSDDFHVPEMKNQAAVAYLQYRFKGDPAKRIGGIPGYVDSVADLQTNTLTIRYKSSSIRKMNFEEAIALAGFSVNHRPANPKATLPAGVK